VKKRFFCMPRLFLHTVEAGCYRRNYNVVWAQKATKTVLPGGETFAPVHTIPARQREFPQRRRAPAVLTCVKINIKMKPINRRRKSKKESHPSLTNLMTHLYSTQRVTDSLKRATFPCYYAEFRRSRSNASSKEIRLKNLTPSVRPFNVTQDHPN